MKPRTPPKKRSSLPSAADVLSRESRKVLGPLHGKHEYRSPFPPPQTKSVIKPPPRFRGWDRAVVSLSLLDGGYLDIGRVTSSHFKKLTTNPERMARSIAATVEAQLTAMLAAKRALTAKVRSRG
jgi:hypothetical protein